MSVLSLEALSRLARHLWLDADDAFRALGEDGLDRLEQRVGASERSHSGQICLCVEASLPLRYLWRNLRHREPIADIVRDRAITVFGKQRVWDTEYNNGVLIYVQLAEHLIEIVADRGLARHVDAAHWRAIVEPLGAACRGGRLESGLEAAIDAVGHELETWFPLHAADAPAHPDRDLDNRARIR